MIVATPLDLPIIEPDDWSVFWKIWNMYAKPLIKTYNNHKGSYAKIGDTSIWKGIDIHKKNLWHVAWQAPYYDVREELPKMYQMIESCSPFVITDRVRIIESLQNITSHTDDNFDQWNVRAILRCTDKNPQWVFTRPGTTKNALFFQLPESTNWFAYNDKHCWHGSIYNPEHPKLLIQLYGAIFKNKELLTNSIEKYKEYTISYD
jgi:hypothetical protein